MPRKPDSSSDIKFVIHKGRSVPQEQDHRPQLLDFEFIHGKDRESRTRVRKHVMRGWRRHKKQQFDSEVEKSRGRWASKETLPEADLPGASFEESPPQLLWYGFGDAASSLDDRDADWDLDDLSFPNSYPESNCVPDRPDYGHVESDPALRTGGAGRRADVYGCIPSRLDNREHSVVDNTINEPPERLFGFSPPPYLDFSPSLASTPGTEDPTQFHETMVLSSTHNHSDQRRRDSTPDFLHQKLEAIRHMNLALSNQRESTSDEIIQIALYIAGVEVCPLDLIDQESPSSGIARIHLSGIRRMIQLRNSHKHSRFSRRLEMELLGAEYLIPTAPDSVLFTPSHIPSSREELIDFFTDLQCLYPTTRQQKPLIPRSTRLHAVLSTPSPPETALTGCCYHVRQFSQLASLFYLCSATLDFHSSSRPQFQQSSPHFPSSPSSKSLCFFAALESQLQDCRVPSRFTPATSPHMLLWILLSGLNQPAFDDRDCGWRVARLMHVAKCVAPERRQQWRDVMLDFLTGVPVRCDERDSRRGGFDMEEVRGEILREGY